MHALLIVAVGVLWFAVTNTQAGELIILALILVLLFGSKSVPELAKGFGELIKNIRSAFSDAADKVEDLGNQVNELNDIKEKVDKKRK